MSVANPCLQRRAFGPDYMLDCFVPPIVGIDGIAGDPLAGISVLFSGNYEFRRFCFSRTQKRA